MTRQRLFWTTIVVFVTGQILGVLIHGFILAADYRPFYGTLLRPFEANPGWQLVLLPIVHLVVAIGLVQLARLMHGTGTTWQRGLRIGTLGWLLGPGSMFLLWYAEQPWPESLVVKQQPLELGAMVVLGTIAARLSSSPAS